MSEWIGMGIDGIIIAMFLGGIYFFRAPRGARTGNALAAAAMALATVLVLYRNGVVGAGVVAGSLGVGALVGWLVAARVRMINIPALVAFQHGAGGVAAFLVSYVELSRDWAGLEMMPRVSGFLGLTIGSWTFAGSMVASGKLSGRLKQTPTVLPGHNRLLLVMAVVVALSCGFGWMMQSHPLALFLTISLSGLLGIVFSMRIGGADMPVLISFLNATAGVAAAFCGVIIQNRLLIACGATVAASGSILTHVMCKAMNRNLLNVFVGLRPTREPRASQVQARLEIAEAGSVAQANIQQDPLARAVDYLHRARSLVVVPGYGMALAQAQFKVVELAKFIEQQGKSIAFAIHPVAGRMPGHMNVLLAEADVDYESLKEMDEVNPGLSKTDVVLVVGACDVVNPQAIKAEGTPISGMPIILAHEAGNVIVCNLDTRPGYSGVENSLYAMPGTVLLTGDAKDTVTRLLDGLKALG